MSPANQSAFLAGAFVLVSAHTGTRHRILQATSGFADEEVEETGIGAGAHGKISPESGKICRTRKQRQPSDYLNPDKQFLAECETVNTNELAFEFMLNTTRLQQVIPNGLFTERTGLPFQHLEPKLLEAEAKGLINRHENIWQITVFGRRYTNNLQALFLSD